MLEEGDQGVGSLIVQVLGEEGSLQPWGQQTYHLSTQLPLSAPAFPLPSLLGWVHKKGVYWEDEEVSLKCFMCIPGS